METDCSSPIANTGLESGSWTAAGIQSCEICCIQFNSYKEWLQHYLVQHKDDEEKIFKCDQCEENFSRKVDLVCHKLTHSEEKAFRCDECGEKFSRVEVFIGHMNSHMPEGVLSPIQSDLISQSNEPQLSIKKEYREEEMDTQNEGSRSGIGSDLTQEEEMKQKNKHLIQLQVNVSMVNDHMCDVCGQCFDRQFLLTQHKNVHMQSKLHFCEICNRSFRTEEQFSRHKESDIHEKMFRCEHCECFFTRKGNLKRHMLNIHPVKKPYKCQECDEGFHLEEDLKRHIKNHIHEKLFATQEVVDPSKSSLALSLFRGLASKFHKCDQCGKVFNQKGNLARHMLTHTGERRFKCHLCSKAFFQRSHLDKHLRMHKNKKSISKKKEEEAASEIEMCHICGELLGGVDELYRHMITHKIYHCRDCRKEFKNEEEFVMHRATHSNDNERNKVFKTEEHLVQHDQSPDARKGISVTKKELEEDSTEEENEDSVNNDQEDEMRNEEESEQSADNSDASSQTKPTLVCYPCKQCGKVLSSESNLKRHLRTHKEDKPHTCVQCGKLFLSRGNLSRHMLIHTGEKPFKCEKCGKGFSQRPHLKKHLRKMHDEDSLTDKVLSYINA